MVKDENDDVGDDFAQSESRPVHQGRLWAPWRMQYILGAAANDADSANPKGDRSKAPKSLERRNFIVDADASSDDRVNLVVLRTEWSIVILNRYPYNNGHVLVAPRRAAPELTDLNDAELLDVQRTLSTMVGALRRMMNPDGFNIGLNLGKAAGAGLPEHLHWHIVPRWNGDVNFMTVTGDTRVIVQSLDELWIALTQEIKRSST